MNTREHESEILGHSDQFADIGKRPVSTSILDDLSHAAEVQKSEQARLAHTSATLQALEIRDGHLPLTMAAGKAIPGPKQDSESEASRLSTNQKNGDVGIRDNKPDRVAQVTKVGGDRLDPPEGEGPQVGLAKDKDGNTQVTVTKPDGKPTWKGTFDKEGKLVGFETRDQSGSKIYDSKGNQLTSITKDKAGRIIETVSIVGDVTNSVYDKRGILSMKMVTDKLGRLESLSDATGKTTTLAYDRDGNLSLKKSAEANPKVSKAEDKIATPLTLKSLDEDGNELSSVTVDGKGYLCLLESEHGKVSRAPAKDRDVLHQTTVNGQAVNVAFAVGFTTGGVQKTETERATESEKRLLSRQAFNMSSESLKTDLIEMMDPRYSGFWRRHQTDQAYVSLMWREARQLSADPKQLMADSLNQKVAGSPVLLSLSEATQNTAGIWEKVWTSGIIQVTSSKGNSTRVFGLPKDK